MDRENVIKAYKCCKNSFDRICEKCPYEKDCCHDGIPMFVIKKMVDLLKEQEDMGKELTDAVELVRKKNERIEKLLKEQDAEWIEYPECLAYDGAYSDSHIVCSACKHVFSIMDNCTEEFDYCPHCGAKMKQEGG